MTVLRRLWPCTEEVCVARAPHADALRGDLWSAPARGHGRARAGTTWTPGCSTPTVPGFAGTVRALSGTHPTRPWAATSTFARKTGTPRSSRCWNSQKPILGHCPEIASQLTRMPIFAYAALTRCIGRAHQGGNLELPGTQDDCKLSGAALIREETWNSHKLKMTVNYRVPRSSGRKTGTPRSSR